MVAGKYYILKMEIESTVSISLPTFGYALFLVQAALFFGEEYGWRGFLQEKMQRRFGKRIGVILLGIIWELWYMPIWFSVYRVDGLGLALRFLFMANRELSN